jgi:integrase
MRSEKLKPACARVASPSASCRRSICTVDLNTRLNPASKEYRHKTVAYLFRSWPDLADRIPARVTEGECKAWAASYHQRFSETLYNNTVDSLRHILALAIDRRLIARNPAESIHKTRVSQKKLELPSSDQFRQIVAHIRGKQWATSPGSADLIEFLAYSGCRINEAVRVRWSDIDDVRGRIWIAPGKNSTARHVPILSPMRTLLDDMKARPRYFRPGQRYDGDYLLSVAQMPASPGSRLQGCWRASLDASRFAPLVCYSLYRVGRRYSDCKSLARPSRRRRAGNENGHLRDEHGTAMAAKVSFRASSSCCAKSSIAHHRPEPA